MKLRSLNDKQTKLAVLRQRDGDIVVSIQRDVSGDARERFAPFRIDVRVGGCGSGHSVPRRIWQLLNELATEFEKYEDCENEQHAYWKEEEKEVSK